MCINQLLKKQVTYAQVKSYVELNYRNRNYTFVLNKRRLKWHIKNNSALLRWARGEGVNI